MPRTGHFHIFGLSETIDTLKQVGVDVQERIIMPALTKAAEPILEAAQRYAPVSVDGSHGNPAGTLRDSLVIKKIGRTKRNAFAVHVDTSEGAYKGAAFYAAFHEYGTRKMAARPFMRPAFDDQKKNALAIFTHELKVGCEQVAKSLAKHAAKGK